MRDLAKKISRMGLMIALIVVSRQAFSALPSIQPITFLIMMFGVVYGKREGFVMGAVGGFASSIGPWVLFQMAAWGLLGFLGGVLGKRGMDKNWQLAIIGLIADFYSVP